MVTMTQSIGKPAGKEAPRAPSFMRDEFPLIRKALIGLIICLLIGAGMVSASQALLDKQQALVLQAQALANKAREKRRQAEVDLHDLQDYQPKYLQLIAQGFVGPERRLNWMETIQTIQSRAMLLPINYEVTEQQTIQVDPSVDIGTMALHGSKMTVHMKLMDELDLLHFLDKLKVGQYYDLQSCAIKRLQEGAQNMLEPSLQADCTMVWITLEQRSADPGNAGGP